MSIERSVLTLEADITYAFVLLLIITIHAPCSIFSIQCSTLRNSNNLFQRGIRFDITFIHSLHDYLHLFRLICNNHLSYPKGNGDAKLYENFSEVKVNNNLDQPWIQVEWPSQMNRFEMHVPELYFPFPIKARTGIVFLLCFILSEIKKQPILLFDRYGIICKMNGYD